MDKSAIKSMQDMGGAEYAEHEGWDIQQACSALTQVMALCQGECDEGEMDEAQALCAIGKSLIQYMAGECDEMMSAMQDMPADGADDDAGEGEMPTAMMSAYDKAISKREDVNPKEGTNKYGNVTFADEKNKKYPIDTAEHIRAAWNYINKSGNAGKYSASEVATIKRKIIAAWKDKIDKAGPPSAQGKSEVLSFNYIKSLHLPKDEQFYRDVVAVKAIGADDIRGYNILWGSPDLTDIEHEFFTKATNFWDDRLGFPRPLTWDHGQDGDTKASPVIGQMAEFGDDDIGRWYTAQLDRSHKYRKAIDKLISARDLGTSSDSAPQYVVREKTASGAVWLKQWPLFASALTTTPAEPRMFDTVYFKALSIVLPDAEGQLETARDMADALARFELLKRY